MTDDIGELVRSKILADPVLSVWIGGTSPIGFYFAGARIRSDMIPPYIKLITDSGETPAPFGPVTVTFEVYDDNGSDARARAYARIYTIFQGRRLAKPGLAILRLNQTHVANGIPDRVVGSVKLVAVFTGEAVSSSALYT